MPTNITGKFQLWVPRKRCAGFSELFLYNYLILVLNSPPSTTSHFPLLIPQNFIDKTTQEEAPPQSGQKRPHGEKEDISQAKVAKSEKEPDKSADDGMKFFIGKSDDTDPKQDENIATATGFKISQY